MLKLSLPPVLSHTQLSVLQDCPRRYFWSYIAGLRSLDKVGLPALWSRSLVHPSLAALVSGEDWGNEWMVAYAAYVKEGGPLAAIDPLYSLGVARRLVDYYAAEQLSLDQEKYEWIGSEERHSPPAGIPYVAIPDAVLRHRETGEVWCLDFKTTTRFSEGADYLLPFSSQMVGQCYATGAIGWLISEFVLGKPTKIRASVSIDHTRYEVRLQEDHLKEWRHGLSVLSSQRDAGWDMRHLSPHPEQAWPQRIASCYSFGRPCAFLDLCKAGGFGLVEAERMQAELKGGD